MIVDMGKARDSSIFELRMSSSGGEGQYQSSPDILAYSQGHEDSKRPRTS